VQGREGSSPDQVVVDVDVEEQPTGSLGFSVNYSTDSGAGFAINFSERNFLGRGQRLRFAINTVSDGQAFNFAFTEPNFLARDVSLGFNLYYEQTQNRGDRSFDTEEYGFGTTFGFPAGENSRIALSYTIDRDEFIFSDDAEDRVSRIIFDDAGERITSAIGLTYAFDNRTSGLNPNAGVRLEVTGEYAGIGGDAEYLRARALAIAERAIMREEVTLRATMEGGALETLNGDSHYSDRFFLSSRQLRGFDTFGVGPRDLASPNEDALGGNYFAVARFEAAFPLGLPEEYGISGGVFYDIGSVWGLDDTAGGPASAATPTTVDDDLYWRSAVGFSIFWDTALGPLRFNFSRALQKQPYDETRDFDFTVETRF
jgi:outer membrane protein insertion porin family